MFEHESALHHIAHGDAVALAAVAGDARAAERVRIRILRLQVIVQRCWGHIESGEAVEDWVLVPRFHVAGVPDFNPTAVVLDAVQVIDFASPRRQTPCFRASHVADSNPDCYASANLKIWTFAYCR